MRLSGCWEVDGLAKIVGLVGIYTMILMIMTCNCEISHWPAVIGDLDKLASSGASERSHMK